MFFSEKYWKSTDEFNRIIPVSSALSFDKVAGSLQAADDLFLTPLLGDDLMERMETVYGSQSTATELEKKLLKMLKKAEANIAFWYDFQELNLRITDQGFQRQQTENFTGAYKYQEDELKRSFRNKGFNALDNILAFLELYSSEFEEYLSAPAYQDLRQRVVQTPQEVNEVYFINNSRLVFLRMLPILREVEDTKLPLILGESLNEELRAAIAEDRQGAAVGYTTYKELRLRAVNYVVFKAVAQLARQGGDITDRGLYFSTVETGDGNTRREPASHEQAGNIAMVAERSAENYSHALTMFVKNYIPEQFAGHESDVLKRDNEHRTTFWA